MATWAVVFVMLGVTMATTKDAIILDMAPNSVDDMYHGCKEKMLTKVKKEFLPQEKKQVKAFTLAWNEAEKYYNKKWSPHKGNRLTKEQIMAIYTYTLDEVYIKFNEAVRTGKNNYKSTFMYHTLHFFLTDAIQVLNSERQRCVTAYRGIDITMKEKKKIFFLKGKFRFGSFASSSLDRNISLEFGNKTCFKIYTCFGADITRYSSVEEESEVLIPPYEVFKVVKSEKRTKKNKLPCEAVYTVKSTNTPKSNLNCALFRNKQSPLCNKMCNNTLDFLSDVHVLKWI